MPNLSKVLWSRRALPVLWLRTDCLSSIRRTSADTSPNALSAPARRKPNPPGPFLQEGCKERWRRRSPNLGILARTPCCQRCQQRSPPEAAQGAIRIDVSVAEALARYRHLFRSTSAVECRSTLPALAACEAAPPENKQGTENLHIFLSTQTHCPKKSNIPFKTYTNSDKHTSDHKGSLRIQPFGNRSSVSHIR